MTKTQANEPGFVQLPDGWLAIEMKAAEAEIAKWPDGLRASFESLLCPSAPLVPSPPYGGVKEALEPFAKAAGELTPFRDSLPLTIFTDTLRHLTVRDLRRASAAYDALSPVAVEEADAKAGEPVGKVHPLGWKQTIISEVWERLEGPFGLQRNVERQIVADGVEIAWAILRRSGFTVAAPATPSPQIGKAGAGPVGEAAALAQRLEKDAKYLQPRAESFAYSFEELNKPDPLLQQWAGECLRKAYDLDEAIRIISAQAARPVEEPGEVERLRDEGFALAANQCRYGYGDEHGNHRCAEIDRLTREAHFATSALAESEQNAQGLASDLAGTQAELAETRERLEKELRRAGFALDEALSVIDAEADPVTYSRLQAAAGRTRAALTGDAQEAGR